jgi:carbon monoxide dehydrogenase subunit G
MKLEQTFEVQAPLDQVWAALNDLERVAPCLPGATIGDRDEDGTYHGTFQVKLGPMTAAYRGTIRIDEADETTHTATLKAKGTDKRGQGGASATIVNRLSEHDGGTRVEAVTDFTITGRLAQFGRGGMMQDVSNRLLRDFATCLQSRLAEAPAAPAVPSGASVTAGDAGPEAVAAAAEPRASTPPGAESPAPAEPPPSAPADVQRPPVAAPPPAAAPLRGGSLFLSVLWERIKRLFKRG